MFKAAFGIVGLCLALVTTAVNGVIAGNLLMIDLDPDTPGIQTSRIVRVGEVFDIDVVYVGNRPFEEFNYIALDIDSDNALLKPVPNEDEAARVAKNFVFLLSQPPQTQPPQLLALRKDSGGDPFSGPLPSCDAGAPCVGPGSILTPIDNVGVDILEAPSVGVYTALGEAFNPPSAESTITFPVFTYTFQAVHEGSMRLVIEPLFDGTGGFEKPILGNRGSPGDSNVRRVDVQLTSAEITVAPAIVPVSCPENPAQAKPIVNYSETASGFLLDLERPCPVSRGPHRTFVVVGAPSWLLEMEIPDDATRVDAADWEGFLLVDECGQCKSSFFRIDVPTDVLLQVHGLFRHITHPDPTIGQGNLDTPSPLAGHLHVDNIGPGPESRPSPFVLICTPFVEINGAMVAPPCSQNHRTASGNAGVDLFNLFVALSVDPKNVLGMTGYGVTVKGRHEEGPRPTASLPAPPDLSLDLIRQLLEAVEVTPRLRITRSGFRVNRLTQQVEQEVTLRNISDQPISVPETGSVWLALEGLSQDVTLVNRTGDIPLTQIPFLQLNVGLDKVLHPKERCSVVLEFDNPTNVDISFSTRVLAESVAGVSTALHPKPKPPKDKSCKASHDGPASRTP
jgi:hypothetical protein